MGKAVTWDWDSFWSCYKSNPEMLQGEVDRLPDFISSKSTKVQIVILQDAPKEIIDMLKPYLTFDAQIEFMQ